jgi:hypothetical protein
MADPAVARFPSRHLIICLVCLVTAVSAQKTSQAEGFHWDWRGAKELSRQNSVSKSSDLSDVERASLVGAVLSQLNNFHSHLDSLGEQELQKDASDARIEMIDLGGDGRKEAIVQAVGIVPCSVTGNCDFWVFKRSGQGYSAILHGLAQSFTIQPTHANGWSDIVLVRHGSATVAGLKLYRFSGSVYRPHACYDASWQYLGRDGERHRLKDPQITRCSK